MMQHSWLVLWLAPLTLFALGCEKRADIDETQSKRTVMPPPVVEFTARETELLRELKIAVFRNKIILDARDPVTDAELTEVEKKVDGKVSPELLALWKTSFGGELDYDYEVQFGDHRYSASLRELFYPGSDHYHDLNGWIEHELELSQEVAEEQGKPIPQRCSVIPFGGFDYLERFYVSLLPGEYGTVVVYAQGIPWKGDLNENSIATVARTVAELFDQLSLDEDPFDEESEKYAAGKDMVKRIREIQTEHPELAKKLTDLVRSSIFNWQAVIETADFTRQLSPKESKALRLALEFAVNRRDTTVVDDLYKRGAPFSETLRGTMGVLSFAMVKKAFPVVSRLLDLNVDVGGAPIIDATECSNALLLRLIEHRVQFDEDAIYSAAETGALDGAIALVHSKQVMQAKSTAKIIHAAEERARSNDEDAVKIETGRLGSYLTADQYRDRARSLRLFADRLRNGK